MQNKKPDNHKIICIGGSAGSFKPLIEILKNITVSENFSVFICVHRGKTKTENLLNVLSAQSGKKIIEPDDKTPFVKGSIYLAPENYHLLLDDNCTISLSYDEEVHFSRPSIDVLFHSVARCSKQNTIGIILSGANSDGSGGMFEISKRGGICIVQSPEEAEIKTMPISCQHAVSNAIVLTCAEIAKRINSIH